MPDIPPFILQHPRITLNADDAAPVDIECSANEVHTNVSQDETTVQTFCGTYTSYKAEVWDVTLAALGSYGDEGLWTLVRPLVGLTVPFELLPDSTAPVSVDNPLMSGMATVKAFPFIDGAIGEASSFDLVLAVQGEPEWATVPEAARAANTPDKRETAAA